MAHHPYLIVGGGMTADAAVRGIREIDSEAGIGVIGEEPHPPYDRPPLTKGLWKGMEEDRIWRDTGDLEATLHLGRQVIRIDPEARSVTDDRGGVYTYEKLLLATGGKPRTLPDAPPQVTYFRTVEDYRRLRGLAKKHKRFAVIGGGFIGSEMAAALAMNGRQVTLLFPEEGICGRVLPPGLAGHLNVWYREKGVDVRPGVTVTSVRRSGDRLLVAVDEEGADTLRVDGVVAGLGIRPNTWLAEGIGLDVEDGIVVDAHFRTRDPRIWAAGDCAAFWSPVLGRRLRIEHEDHANQSGHRAGRAMAGDGADYDYLPLFYSDLFDVGYEAVGELDPSSTELVEDWVEPNRTGVVYYLREGRVGGVLLWDVWGKVGEARELITSRRKVTGRDLIGRIRPD